MFCLLQDGCGGHTLHQCQTWQWESPMRQLWPCKQKLSIWAKTSLSFPTVRSSVPATPGAPPEVFAEARMELWAAVLGLFYMRIESTGKTILTDFLVGGSVICRFSDVCWLNNTFGKILYVWLKSWGVHVRHFALIFKRQLCSSHILQIVYHLMVDINFYKFHQIKNSNYSTGIQIFFHKTL